MFYKLSPIYPFSSSKDIVIFLINSSQFKLEHGIQDLEAELLVMGTEPSITSKGKRSSRTKEKVNEVGSQRHGGANNQFWD